MKYIVGFSGVQKKQLLDKFGLDNGRTQKNIDSTFMGYMEPYMPKDGSQMITNMYSSTKVGSGEININTPYAHYQHEGVKYVDPKYKIGAFHDPISGRYWSRPGIKKVSSSKRLTYHGGALRGSHFIERMLADHFNDILNAGQKEIDK